LASKRGEPAFRPQKNAFIPKKLLGRIADQNRRIRDHEIAILPNSSIALAGGKAQEESRRREKKLTRR
jgi:hypothetical protein